MYYKNKNPNIGELEKEKNVMMTRKIATQKFLVRLTQCLMFLSIILIIIVIMGDIKIKSMEQPTIIMWESIFVAKEPVKEQAKKYVQSLPMPDMSDVPRVQEQPVIIQGYVVPSTETNELTTEEEIYLLAKGIHGEASICDSEEKYKVGTVIMNRVSHSRYPNTVKEVLEQESQYSCYQDVRWFTEEPSKEEIEIARDIYLNGTRVFGPEVIYQSRSCAGKCVDVTKWHEYGID